MRRRLRIRCALFTVLMVWSAVLCAISVSAADAITVVTAAGVPGQRYLMTGKQP